MLSFDSAYVTRTYSKDFTAVLVTGKLIQVPKAIGKQIKGQNTKTVPVFTDVKTVNKVAAAAPKLS